MAIDPIFLPFQVSQPIQEPLLPVIPAIISPEVPNPPSLPVANEGKKEVVLVTGVNFSKEIEGKRIYTADTFYKQCKRLVPRLVDRYADAKITIFHFTRGTREEFQFVNHVLVQPVVVRPSPGSLKWDHYRFVFDLHNEEKERYAIVSSAADTPIRYITGISDISTRGEVKRKDYIKAFRNKRLKERSISIGDVYRYIEHLGRKAKGSLVEFHIFSHAWMGGPALVNTEEYSEDGFPIIDEKYLDKDGRPIDFINTYSVIRDFSVFRRAFAEGSFSMIWGCNWFLSPRAIILQVLDSKQYTEMVKEPRKKILQLQFNSDWAEWDEDDAQERFHRLVLDSPQYTTGNKSETKSLRDTTDILQRILNRTYMKKLAEASKRDALGALPGTYAGVDQDYQSDFGVRVMHIPLGKEYLDYQNEKDYPKKEGPFQDFRQILKFYKDHLNVQFRPDGEYDKRIYGRGYAVYKP